MLNKIYKAPPNSGEVILGRTLPSLLDEACDARPNSQAFNRKTPQGWTSLSNHEFRTAAKKFALGLRTLDLEKGDNICLYMESDLNFCLADLACLTLGLVDVPIHLEETPETIAFIIQQVEAKVLIVSNLQLLKEIVPVLAIESLETVIVMENPSTALRVQEEFKLPQLPANLQILSLTEILKRAKTRQPKELEEIEVQPQDLATIIYTAGIGGQPEGVMLTHESIAADILATFHGTPEVQPGAKEIVLSFLPLTHIFARAFVYGHINYGHSIYFSTAKRAFKHLQEVQPTILTTVPLLLQKVYNKIVDKGDRLKGWDRITFDWALNLAKKYQLGKQLNPMEMLQFPVADLLVFSQWRKALGGRIKHLVCGGAACPPALANIFSAAGMTVLQGYGLTETSSVISCNRGEYNRAGTVGVPIAGVEMAIAPDGEILVKAPYVMQGYYKNPTATKQAIDPEGWFHTGDIGFFSPEGFLQITHCKKNLFKLSTGKYVMPEPLETRLTKSCLVEQAVVVGAGHKFCAMLIFPQVQNLQDLAKDIGLHLPWKELLQQPEIIKLYLNLVEEANQGLPHWSTVKRFQLIDSKVTVENGILTQDLKIARTKVGQVFAEEIQAMYEPAFQ